MCEELRLTVANGSVGGDKEGKVTYVGEESAYRGSVLDLVIEVDRGEAGVVEKLEVIARTESDRLLVSFKVKILVVEKSRIILDTNMKTKTVPIFRLGDTTIQVEKVSFCPPFSTRLFRYHEQNSPLSSANAGTSNIKSAAAAERGYKWSKRRQIDIRRDVKDSQESYIYKNHFYTQNICRS
ncbi:hypothetical protein PV326_004209 [Microctonus aethiopoides]|nr:hypothetical protein PV326_004209 [Microctonus aethiopoides]